MCLEKCRHRQNYIVLLEADILTVRIEYVAVDGSIVTVICLINGKNEMVWILGMTKGFELLIFFAQVKWICERLTESVDLVLKSLYF